MLSIVDIKDLLTKGERVSLECKEAAFAVPKSVFETYSSMANTNGGVNVKAMQAMLGHRDIDMTMRIYVDASENLLSHAVDEYEEMMTKMFPDFIPH